MKLTLSPTDIDALALRLQKLRTRWEPYRGTAVELLGLSFVAVAMVLFAFIGANENRIVRVIGFSCGPLIAMCVFLTGYVLLVLRAALEVASEMLSPTRMMIAMAKREQEWCNQVLAEFSLTDVPALRAYAQRLSSGSERIERRLNTVGLAADRIGQAPLFILLGAAGFIPWISSHYAIDSFPITLIGSMLTAVLVLQLAISLFQYRIATGIKDLERIITLVDEALTRSTLKRRTTRCSSRTNTQEVTS